MSENGNRQLRMRRPPAYLMGDVLVPLTQSEDPQTFKYSRTNYMKARSGAIQETVSPAQQANQLAKLLTKFINSVNKNLLENSMLTRRKDDQGTKPEPTFKDDAWIDATPNKLEPKKKVNPKEEQKGSANRSGKEWVSTKNPPQLVPKNKVTDFNKKQSKTLKPAQVGLYPPNNFSSLSPFLQGLTKSMTLMNMNPLSKALEQQQQVLNYNPQLKAKLQPQTGIQIKNQTPSQKFFKRSTYHIAIAYQIHLSNLKESGKDLMSPTVLDPTYSSKRLKQLQQIQEQAARNQN